MEKLLVIFGGPNGCGKSSLYEALRARRNRLPFLNADLIAVAAHGTPGVHGEISAGRIFIRQLRDAIAEGRSIAFETTMSGKSWVNIIKEARQHGYKIISVFVSLDTIEHSLSRIADRVRKGGHDIPEDTVRRRWNRCHLNFWTVYRPLSDSWYLFDNCTKGAILAAQQVAAGVTIFDQKIFSRVENYAK